MAKSERRKLLEEKMKQLNKSNKDKTLLKFGENKDESKYISFGVPQIDQFTGGGSTQGTFTVLYGGKSVGKTTLALQQIASAQKEGKICCLIDLEHGWDKERAEKFGVNLEELVLVETAQTAEQAMDIINELAKDKLVDLVLVDSINAMSPEGEQQTKKGKSKSVADDSMALLARKLGQFFRMVAPHIFRAKISVVMIGQVRTAGIGSFYTYAGLSGGNALEHWMSTCLFLRHGQKADAPVVKRKVEIPTPDGGTHKKTVTDQIGFDCVIRMDKTKNSNSASEGSDIHIPFYFQTGFHPPLAITNPVSDEELENAVKTSTDIGEIDVKVEKPEADGEAEIIKKFSKKGRKKALKNLTEQEFDVLNKTGMLKDVYPDAPEAYEEIE